VLVVSRCSICLLVLGFLMWIVLLLLLELGWVGVVLVRIDAFFFFLLVTLPFR
jgi:hypothetical protein